MGVVRGGGTLLTGRLQIGEIGRSSHGTLQYFRFISRRRSHVLTA
jgi:hypothetical protein